MTQYLGQTTRQGIYPSVENFVAFYFHPVLEDTDEIPYENHEVDERTKDYILKLETQLGTLKKELSRLKKVSTNESPRYVLQISVRANAPHPVYWYRHTVYEKVQNFLTKMEPADIVARVKSAQHFPQ